MNRFTHVCLLLAEPEAKETKKGEGAKPDDKPQSKLNPNAKAFTMNINAKPFVPSFAAKPAQEVHSSHYGSR